MITSLKSSASGFGKAFYGLLTTLLMFAAMMSPASSAPQPYNQKGTFNCGNEVGSSTNQGPFVLSPNQTFIYRLSTNGSSIGSAAALEIVTKTGIASLTSALAGGSANGDFVTYTPNETHTWVGASNANFDIDFTVKAGSSGGTFDFKAWCTNTSVSINDVTVAENAGPGVFTVKLAAIQSKNVLVDYSMAGGTAAAGVDFTAVSGTLTIPAGSLSATISVPITNDNLVEPTETATVTLSNARTSSGSFVTIGDPSGLLSITNDDVATLSVSGGSQLENVTNRAFTITLSSPVSTNTVVTYAISNGTAVSPVDYTATMSGTVTINANETSVAVPVTVVNDSAVESSEDIKIAISAAGFAAANGTMTILDDDAATLSINDVTVNEGAGTAKFTVTLSAPSSVPVTVNYASSNVTAIAGSDYGAVSGTISIPAGVTTANFTVNIINDLVVEPDETATLVLTSPVSTAAITIADGTGILTITDDDKASLSIADVSVTEGPGATAVFKVTLTGATSASFTVAADTSDDTALAVTDYTTTSTSLSFTGTPGEVVNFTVPIVNDNIAEATEKFKASLSNLSTTFGGALTIATADATGTITDDDKASLSIADVSVTEGPGATAVFKVTLTGATSASFTVAADTSDDTALAVTDYTTTSTSLSFTGTPGEVVNFTVPIVNDNIAEATEKFKASLSNLSTTFGGALTIATADATGTITDDDKASLSIADVSVTEGPGATAVFKVTLTGATSASFTVAADTSDDTALAVTDYTTTSTSLSFTGTPGEVVNFTVPIVNDNIAEATEKFKASLSNLSTTFGGALTIATADATGTITDDDKASLSIADVSVTEGPGATAVFKVTLTGATSASFTVAADTSDDTALAVTDYTTTSTSLSFTGTPGEVVNFTVPIVNDNIAEATEKFKASLSNLSTTFGGALTIATADATGTITDDDKASLSIADVSVTEGPGATAVFKVTLTGATSASFTVAADTSDDTALAVTDYTTTSTSLSFTGTPGEVVNFTVPIVNDNIAEATEKFKASLSNLSTTFGGALTIATADATGTITDDDKASLSIADVSVTEGPGATAVFKVTLTGATSASFTVAADTSDDTALAVTDYTTTSTSLSFTGTPGEVVNFTVPIVNDNIAEATEKFKASLSNLSTTFGGALTIATADATGTITDDDKASLSIADVSVTEGPGATAVFKVTLTGATSASFTVAADTSDDTALAVTDYTTTSTSLSFTGTPGEVVNFTVPIVNDNIAEATEKFKASLSNLSTTFGGALTIATADATGTITDDDKASLSIADVSVTEGPGATAVFKVTLTGATSASFTVAADTSDDTALAVTDYTTTSTSLSFTGTPGEVVNFTVPIVNDNIAEATEKFKASLSNLSTTFGGALTIATADATGTITDDDKASLSIADVSVTEGPGATAVFKVTLTGATSASFTVAADTSDDTALAVTDYTTTSTSLSFTGTPGEVVNFTVPIVNDNIAEATEKFKASLSNLSTTFGGALTIATADATGTITDDDKASLSIADVSVTEGPGATAVFKVTLTGATSASFTVAADTSDDTALAVTDYTTTSTSLSFTGTPGEVVNFTVPIVNDNIAEATEKFKASLSNLSTTFGGALTIATADATGTITDDDKASLSIADVSVTEGPGATAVFKVTLTGATSASFTVAADTSDDTALAVTDYTTTSTSLSFTGTPGEVVNFTVPIVNDNIAEATEKFKASLSNLSTTFGGALTIATADATGTITDDDAVGLSINDVTVNEGDGTATFTVTLTGSSTVPVSVSFATSDGTAQSGPGKDYTSASGTLTFAAGDTSQTFTVPILEDTLVEPAETATVTLSDAVSDGAVTIEEGSGTLTITDNDKSILTVSSTNASEPSTNGKFTFTLSNKSATDTTYTYTVAGTATGGADYQALSGSVTIPANTLSVDVPVTVIDDALIEGPETVDLTLTSTNSEEATAVTATVTIADDDREAASMARNPDKVVVEEGGKTANLSVRVKTKPDQDVVVTATISNGEATLGAVSTVSPAKAKAADGKTFTLTFTPENWDKPQQILVTAVDDTIVDGTTHADVSYKVASEDTRYQSYKLAVTRVDIRDNDRKIAPSPSPIIKDFQIITYNFMSRRESLLASHEPKIFRMVNRPDQGATNTVQVTSSNGSMKGNFALSASSVARKLRAQSVDANPVADLPVPEEGQNWDAWIEGQFAVYDGKNPADTNNGDFFVGYAGVDYSVSEWLKLGVMGELDWMQEKGVTSNVDGTGWMIGPYLTAEPVKNVYFDLRGMWGQSNNTASDTIGGSHYMGDFDTERWLVEAMLSGKYDAGPTIFTPDLKLVYLHESQSDFTVSNGGVPITVPGQTLDLGQLSAGLRVSREFETENGVFEPYVGGRMMWNFDNPGLMDSTGKLVSTEDIDGAVTLGMNYKSGDTQISVEGMYSGFLSDNYEAFSAKLMFTHNF